MYSILCIDDGEDILTIIETALSGYSISSARNLNEAYALFQKGHFDLIIIDLILPDGTGFDFVARQKEKLNRTPVIFLTASTDYTSKASAFALGADDYIEKPFDPRELKLRVDSKLRRKDEKTEDDSVLRIGNLRASIHDQSIRRTTDLLEVPLTSREFRLFWLLAKNPNRIFSRENILDRVWGNGVAITDRTVDVHISNLRKKLAPLNVTIDTVIGVGYRISFKGQSESPAAL